jgi:homoserine kinase
MTSKKFVTAFAPASIGNVAVGYDMLGLAIAGAGDRVAARRTGGRGISILQVRGPDGEIHPFLETDPHANTASLAAAALWDAMGDGDGVELLIHKGIPLQSGMGSSAASAVAGAVAVNALLDQPLPLEALIPYAVEGERYASGSLHADNVAPSLLGGLILCPAELLPQTIKIPVPAGICSVLLHPDMQINTAESRRGLARGYTSEQWLAQQGYLATFIAACFGNDPGLFGKCLKDIVIEPQRAASVPCFPAVKDAALKAGAFGCSLSGSGPSMFALCAATRAANVATAMEQACRKTGYECTSYTSPMDARGAFVEDDK